MSESTTLLRGLGRRGFLAGMGATASSIAFTPGAQASMAGVDVGPFVRRDVWSGATPWNDHTEAYARAVRLMQSRDPADPTSWAYQVAIHGTYTKPFLPTWNKCQHQSWYFLPWHRMYVYFFERIVRAAVLSLGGPEDFALPYWNYERPFPANTLPAAFREPALPDGTDNPLYLPSRRSTAMMSGFQLGARTVSTATAMSATAFSADPALSKTSFGGGAVAPKQFAGALGALELQPHNPVHSSVGGPTAASCTGGYMSAVTCAANDPIFFLHHANIDRLWDAWLAQGGGRANPTDPAWLGQAFSFYDEQGQLVSISTAQVLDTEGQLTYVYAA